MESSPDLEAELRALEDQNAQLLALFLASQRLASSLQLDQVRNTILDILVEFTGAAAVSVWLADDLSTHLGLFAERGLEGSAPPSIGPGAGLVGGVAATGEETLECDGRLDPETGLPIVAVVPLQLEAKTVGAVAVHRLLPQKRRLEESDHELLRLIAGQAAAAITSARLHSESRAVVRGFRDLAQQVAAHVDDLETVLSTTVTSVAALLRADLAEVFLLDEEGGHPTLRAASWDLVGGSDERSSHREDLVELVLAEGRAIRSDGDPGSAADPKREPLGPVLSVPLRVGAEPIGALLVERSPNAPAWDPDDELVLGAAADQLAVGINNARLYSRLEDNYFKTSTLFMAANRLHATLDLEEILRSARDVLESLIGAQTYAIVLLDDLSAELRIAVAAGIPGPQRATFRAVLGQGLIGRVVESGQSYVAPAGKQPRERVYGQPVLACLPLRVEGAIVGAIVINRLAPQKPGLIAYDNELFSLLTQHAATAILAAQLYARAEQKLVTLYDLSRLISAAVSAEEILEVTMGLVTEVMRARVAVLYAADREASALRIAHAAGLGAEEREATLDLAEGILGQVVASGEAAQTEDAATDRRFAGLGSFYRGPTLVLPLKLGSSVVGCLVIADKLSAGPFDDDDQRLAGALATQVALIMHHTSLYQQAQHLAILLEREREALQVSNRDLELVNRQLDALVEHLTEGAILVDAAGRVLRLNAAGRRILGIPADVPPPSDVVGFGYLDARASDGRPLPFEEWPINQARRGEAVSSFDLQITAGGHRRELEVSAGPILGPSGEVAMAVVVFRDVTEQRAVERAKDEFISTASHELKTPLTALKGHAQILLRQAQREGGTEAETRGLLVIDEQADRVLRLVDRLLDVSRLELGRLQLELEPVDLVALARRVARDEGLVNPGHGIDVVSSEPGIVGNWDRARIEQVVDNLLSNAVKFSPPGTTILVSLERTDDWAHLLVRDQGPGVAPDQVERIFERYAQGADRPRGTVGLGLGLYVSRRIVEAHGGRIWVESIPGAGATFHVRLPLGPAVSPESASHRQPEATSRSESNGGDSR